MGALGRDDPEVAALVERERARQRATLNLIASENTAPAAVNEALGSIFGNKTAEGYPGRRYHRGTAVADELETLAIERAKALFGADHANVQVHAGVNANLAVYQAVLRPGDRVIALDLDHGGHLSHGASASITSRILDVRHYGVRPDTEQIDLDDVRALALEHGPRMIVTGGSSYPRRIDHAGFRAIADEVGAVLLVDMAHIAGLVAAEVLPSPVPHADFVTFTTYKTLNGPHGGIVLCRAEHARALDRAVFPGTQGAPSVSQIAAKAVALQLATTPAFRETQARTVRNATVLAAALGDRGFRFVTGGTDTHMVLVDLRSKAMTGDIAEVRLEAAGLLVNRNVIPFDPASTKVTSGIRIGTPGVTVRGFGDAEMTTVADLIDRTLASAPGGPPDPEALATVARLCAAYPLTGRDLD
jgi:glycine hydroxymethyltransferase